VTRHCCATWAARRNTANDGPAATYRALFYYFRLEDQIPDDHLLKGLDRFIDFGFVRERLRDTYSAIWRESSGSLPTFIPISDRIIAKAASDLALTVVAATQAKKKNLKMPSARVKTLRPFVNRTTR